jgi:hypothetical protein
MKTQKLLSIRTLCKFAALVLLLTASQAKADLAQDLADAVSTAASELENVQKDFGNRSKELKNQDEQLIVGDTLVDTEDDSFEVLPN